MNRIDKVVILTVAASLEDGSGTSRGHPDKNRACGDCLDEAVEEIKELERLLHEMAELAGSFDLDREERAKVDAILKPEVNQIDVAKPKGCSHTNRVRADGEPWKCRDCGVSL